MCFSRIRLVLLPMSLVLLIGFPVAAQEPDNTVGKAEIDNLEKIVAAFFTELQTVDKKSEDAFQKVLLKGSDQLLKKQPALKSLIKKTDALLNGKYGKYRGSDRISAKSIGKDLVLLTYLYKCEDYPIVWHFTFYRKAQTVEATASQWIVIAVRFDTDLELLALVK
ncbi:MAG: hypothetical protein IIA67_02640 [Planctomycetes bacterium]|nr:hypothetical protein [Planctomycetota bacterium]